jgi:hypothetical protein
VVEIYAVGAAISQVAKQRNELASLRRSKSAAEDSPLGNQSGVAQTRGWRLFSKNTGLCDVPHNVADRRKARPLNKVLETWRDEKRHGLRNRPEVRNVHEEQATVKRLSHSGRVCPTEAILKI